MPSLSEPPVDPGCFCTPRHRRRFSPLSQHWAGVRVQGGVGMATKALYPAPTLPNPPTRPPHPQPQVEEARPCTSLGFVFSRMFPFPADVARAAQLLRSFLSVFQGQALEWSGIPRLEGRRLHLCYPLLLPRKPLGPAKDSASQARLPGSVGCGWAVPGSNCHSQKSVSLTESFWNLLAISSLGKTTERSLSIA